MRHLFLILIVGSSILVKSQGLNLKEVFKIYGSDSVATKQYLIPKGWIYTKDSVGKRGTDLKIFILSAEKRSVNDSMEILWDPAHKRGLMALAYKFYNKNTYENIVAELEKMGATIKNKISREETTIYFYKVPAYDVFFNIAVKNSGTIHYTLMIITPANKMDAGLLVYNCWLPIHVCYLSETRCWLSRVHDFNHGVESYGIGQRLKTF